MRNRGSDYLMLRKRARKLIENDRKLIDELVSIRESKGLDKIVVAKRMGVTVDYFFYFEHGYIDCIMGDIRRYAHALGAVLEYNIVENDVEKS